VRKRAVEEGNGVPNGADKNYRRLIMACAAFRSLHGVWPSEARLAPVTLWECGQMLDLENFELLCSKLRLRTTKHAQIAVGNASAHLVYEKISNPSYELLAEAEEWLGATVKREWLELD
jgi:hypothetical protein